MRRWLARSSYGQILIPAAFALPSLFLFVFLIYEAAKLSREKIRHQFAVDAASFVEMVNYSDFFNRTAYVNGAFPMRIFSEAFNDNGMCFKFKNKVGNGEGECGGSAELIFRALWENGIFPAYVDGDNLNTDRQVTMDPLDKWTIKFSGPHADSKNDRDNPDFTQDECSHLNPKVSGCMETVTYNNAYQDFWVTWDDAHKITDLYIMVYELLGSVEDAQKKVFERLTDEHVFYGKSYWLNTGDDPNTARDGVDAFRQLATVRPRAKCVPQVFFYGNQLINSIEQPYKMYSPKEPMKATQPMPDCDPDGLFQIEFVKPSELNRLRSKNNNGYPGIPIVQHWTAPSNYFKVNMNSLPGVHGCEGGSGGLNGKPCVHATISTGYTMPSDAGVWPNPTPKFQTELFP